jgi:hypothetical protein
MPIPFERRKSQRFKCNKDILHNTDPSDFFYRGKVCNYSEKGLYFESNVDLLPGDKVSILVKRVSNDVTHLLDVKIIWSKHLQGESFDLAYGASLKKRRKIGVR